MRFLADWMVVGAVACGLVVASGCRSGEASAQTGGAGATMNGTFQTRNPRPCPSVRGRPSNAEAAALVQCTEDSVARDHIMLMQNVSVAVGAGSAEQHYQDQEDIDVTGTVYSIKGSMVLYNCQAVSTVMNNAGKNCYVSESRNMTGLCYRIKAGVYRCRMGGGDRGFVHLADPGPVSY